MAKKEENLFEKKLERLQEIVTSLEEGNISLKEGMNLYKEGVECSKFCHEELRKAKHELSLWQESIDNLEYDKDNGDDDIDEIPF